MVTGPVLMELFSYQYRPYRLSQGVSDGGFKVALMANGTVVYTTYSAAQVVTASYVFPVSQEVVNRFMLLSEDESWWISRLPLNILKPSVPGYRAMIGVFRHPMFTVDDLEEAARLPFNSERGLLARRLMVLLENVSELLISCGLYITPNSFIWDNRVTGPMIISELAM